MRLPVGAAGLRAALLIAAVCGAAALAKTALCPDLPTPSDDSPATLEALDAGDECGAAGDFVGELSPPVLLGSLLASTHPPGAAAVRMVSTPPRRASVSRAPPSPA